MWTTKRQRDQQREARQALITSVDGVLVAWIATLDALDRFVTRVQAGDVPNRAALQLWRRDVDAMRALVAPFESMWTKAKHVAERIGR